MPSGVSRRARRRERTTRTAEQRAAEAKGLGNLAASIARHAGKGRISEDQSAAEQVLHFKHWVYAAVNARATSVAQATLRVFLNLPDGERREITKGEPGAGQLIELLDRPNPFQTWWQLVYKTQVFLDLTGDSYWYLERNTIGRIVKVWMIPPQNMSVSLAKDGTPTYEYDVGHGDTVTYQADEIAHGLYPDPNSQVYGVSPLQAATEAVNVHASLHTAQDKSFQQGAEPGLVLTTEAKLDKEQIDRLRSDFNRDYQGADKAGRVLILQQGLQAKPWTLSPKEMNYLESGKMNREELLAIYSVSAAILGISEDVNRSSAKSMEYIYSKYAITPLLVNLQNLITICICQDFDDRLSCEFDSVIPADEDAEGTRRREDVNAGLLSANEARAELGLEPAVDGNADALMVDANKVPLATAGLEDDEKPAKPAEEAVAAPMAKAEPDDEKPMPVFDVNAFVEGAVDWIEEAKLSAKGMRPEYEKAYEAGWFGEIALVGGGDKASRARSAKQEDEDGDAPTPRVGIPPEVPDIEPELEAYLASKDFEYFDVLLESTRDDLRDELMAGLAKGESFKLMSDRIQDVYAAERTRSERIARTEAGNARNGAAQNLRHALEVPYKEWIAVFINTRDTHAAADGQVVPNDGSFTVGNSTLRFPRDLAASPSETVNCQCDAAGTFDEKGLDDAIRKAYAVLARDVRTRAEKRMLTVLRVFFRGEEERLLAAFAELGD